MVPVITRAVGVLLLAASSYVITACQLALWHTPHMFTAAELRRAKVWTAACAPVWACGLWLVLTGRFERPKDGHDEAGGP